MPEFGLKTDLSVQNVQPVQVAQATVAETPQVQVPTAAVTAEASKYEGVRRGRKAAAPQQLQLQTPGIKGSSKPAMTDGLGPGWDNIL